jgi:hypothetical protein
MKAVGRSIGVAAALVLMACATPTTTTTIGPGDAAVPWRGWNDLSIPGKRSTRYHAVWEEGRSVVDATALASASMWRRSLNVPSEHLQRLEFSWRVPGMIAGADLTQVDHSDSPARVVLAFDGDSSRLSLRNRMLFDLAEAVAGERPPYATLMYVWANHAEPGTIIHSGRTDRVRKIVVESGASQCGRWLRYQRDPRADYRRAFGEDPGALIGVALMTDADNTGGRASARYGEVRLIGRDGQPL